jgi:hypothetical protein
VQAPANGGSGSGINGSGGSGGLHVLAEINKAGLAKFGQKGWPGTKRAELVAQVAPGANGKIERLSPEELSALLALVTGQGDHSPKPLREGGE